MADVLHSSQGTPSFLHHLRTLLAQVEAFLRKVEVRKEGREGGIVGGMVGGWEGGMVGGWRRGREGV